LRLILEKFLKKGGEQWDDADLFDRKDTSSHFRHDPRSAGIDV